MSHNLLPKVAMYDVAVVGAGAMGSCAAYHLSKQKQKLNVCLIGPGEPSEKSRDHEVFGCHYDEGRITRTITQIETEQVLAYQSMLGYEELERESGLQVYWEDGVCVLGQAGDEFVAGFCELADEFCAKQGYMCEVVDDQFIEDHWRYFVTSGNCHGRYSNEFNGFISIRNLVRACQLVACRNRVKRVLEVAESVKKIDGKFEITLRNGEVILSEKVLVACGSFTNFFNVLPNGKKLDLELIGHTVLKFELNEVDSEMMSGFPSLIYKPNPSVSYVYLLPPIKYPNGKTYIKLGHVVYPKLDENKLGQELETLEEVQQWYCQKDYPKARKYLQNHLKTMFPDVKPVSEVLDFCVMAITSSGKQLLGFAEENWFVAAGGNGKSAKFSLEIGRICADSVVNGEWCCEHLSSEHFKLRYKQEF